MAERSEVGCGCGGCFTTIAFIAFIIFLTAGITIGGTHYSLGACNCDEGIVLEENHE